MDESIAQFFGTATKQIDLHIFLSIVEFCALFSKTIELFLTICILNLDNSEFIASFDIEDLQALLLIEVPEGDWTVELIRTVKAVFCTAFVGEEKLDL